MSNLRIAIVANNIHFRGGMERYCAELATSLCSDHDVHLFASEIDDVPFDKVTVHHVSTVKRPMLTLFLQFYFKSSRMIRAGNYDIVHTIGGITKKQNVVTAQYCQYAWGDVLNSQRGQIDGITPYHQFMWRFTGLFERSAISGNSTLAVSAVSNRTSNDLQRFYGCPAAKIRVIYNGVDPNRFHPRHRETRDSIRRQHGIGSDDFLFLFVGEYRRKGLITAIRALGELGKNSKASLLAIGKKGNIERYTQAARECGVENRVFLAPPARNVEQIYGAADAFVFPTFYEPFGMVITEAMATELPVITTSRAGAAEFIEDGRSGLLVDSPEDSQSVAAKMRLLVDDRQMSNQMGIDARLSVKSYDWARVCSETVSLYNHVCPNSQPIVPSGS